MLCEYGNANVNLTDQKRETPLILAVIDGKVGVVEVIYIIVFFQVYSNISINVHCFCFQGCRPSFPRAGDIISVILPRIRQIIYFTYIRAL